MGIGTTFFAENLFENHETYNLFMVSWAWLCTSFVVAQSVVIERLNLQTHAMWAFWYSVIIFPLWTHWGRNVEWWLADLWYVDLAGAWFIHMAGASSWLAVLLLAGKRVNRDAQERESDFRLSNLPFIWFAALILWFCRFWLNNGSLTRVVSTSNEWVLDISKSVGVTSMNTVVGPATAWLTTFFFTWIFRRVGWNQEEYSMLAMCNGVLIWCVAVSWIANYMPVWGACIIWYLAGWIYLWYSWLFRRVGLDDPIDSIAVNLWCGSLGVVAVWWFHWETGVLFSSEWYHFGVQLLWMVIYFAWPLGTTLLLFLLMKICNWHKLKEDLENTGVDT